jgi:alpha-tubulin suppressor-like RCC1 family protein
MRGGSPLKSSAPYTPSVDFVDNGDGTVTHLKTGLMWKRCAEGQAWSATTCSGTASVYDWKTAVALTSSSAGYSDWRIPNMNELLTIVEYQTTMPSMNTEVFPNAPSAYFWSGSPNYNSSVDAWALDFSVGESVIGSSSDGLRMVRAGQFFGSWGFDSQKNVAPGAAIASNSLKVAPGAAGPVTVFIVGGSYSINGGTYTMAPGTVKANDNLKVKVTSALDAGKTARATLTVGDAAGNFTVTTRSALDTQKPSVPAGLTATVSLDNRINLAWSAATDDVGVASYSVYRNGTWLTTLTVGTGFTDTGLSAATPYSYSVSACDAANNCSPQSAVAMNTTASATTLLPQPTTPASDFVDNTDGTVTHRLTGLTWMRCAMGMAWTGSNCIGTPLTTDSWDQASKLRSNFAGRSDWRLPSIAELNTIAERGNAYAGFNAELFPNNTDACIWSNSPNVSHSLTEMWFSCGTYLSSGNAPGESFRSFLSARMVRGGPAFDPLLPYTPSSDFVDHSDGTVTHLKTGLMWKRCAEGQVWSGSTCSGSPASYDWKAASARTSSSGGHSDWRLPTVNELLTLVEYQSARPAINEALFPNMPVNWNYFWSDSPSASQSGSAWTVDFNSGEPNGSGDFRSAYAVRLVRSDQYFGSWGFKTQIDVTANTLVSSNPLKVVGNGGVITITGGQYSINSGPYTSARGTVKLNDSVTVQVTAASAVSTTTRTTLTIGSISGDFAVTTASDTQAPSAPAILGASTSSSNQVTLTWQTSIDNTAVTTYRLYRDGNLLATTGNTTYTDPQPSGATQYAYSVQACDATGNCSALRSTSVVTLIGTRPASAKLSVGGNHSAALTSDGGLLTWGGNDSGQLGLGVPTSSTDTSNTPQTLGTGFANITLGGSHSAALKQDGSLWTWGGNASGQIGDSSTITRNVPIAIGNGYVAVAAGNNHTLGIKSDGSLWSWGNNGTGQLGDGTSNQSLSPIQVGSSFYTVAAGTSHSAAIKLDGTLWAWGSNNFGQLGDGTGNDRYALTRIGQGFTVVAAGAFHTVALKNDGSLWAWGKNDAGQLGDGTTQSRYAPTQIGTGFSTIAAGTSHTLALRTDGSVWAWGSNESGQLGLGTTAQSPTLQKIVGIAGVTSIAAGGNMSLALKSDGTALAWGGNSSGQLGDGTFGQRVSAVLVVKTGASGFLNLTEDTVLPVPPGLNVPFFVSGTGSITTSSASVATATKFNPVDAGKTGAVFITAMVPNGSLGTTPVAQSMTQKLMAMVRSPTAVATSTIPTYTLVQLTPTGWQTVINSQLIPYASGVLTEQLSALSILNNTNTSALQGAQFCVGYGQSAQDMITNGNIRVVATIPGATSPTSCVVGGTLTVGINVTSGWNLLGNPVKQSIAVPDTFGDASNVTSVWKWDAAAANWQFYAPGLSAADLQAYATSQGYAVLTEINGGDGYWVNAKTQANLGSVAGESINLRESSLSSGWNLVSTASLVTPQYFNLTLSTTPPTLGQVPINLTSLWAWDSVKSNWFFYAPSMEAQGGSALADYITAQRYQDFAAGSKTLGNGVGFWVRR